MLECVHWTNAIKLKTVRPLFSLQPRWKLIKLKNKTNRFIGHFDGSVGLHSVKAVAFFIGDL